MEDSVGPSKKRPNQPPSAADNSSKKPRESPVPAPPSADESAAAEELTRILEMGPEVAPFNVRFVPYPYTWRAIYESTLPSSYITINVGNEESCGSSFSDINSSVMASVDTGGLNVAGLDFWGGEKEASENWDWDELDDALAAFIGEDYIRDVFGLM